MSVEIRRMTIEDKEEILNVFKEYEDYKPVSGLSRYEGIRCLEELKYIEFEEWFQKRVLEENEANIASQIAPQTVYLVTLDNTEIIGFVTLRWKQVATLMKYGGFIGYSIKPSKRGNGYANEMLKKAIEEYYLKTGKDKILLTCKDFNIASKKTIEKNGGVYENTYYNGDDGYDHLRYWITVNSK